MRQYSDLSQEEQERLHQEEVDAKKKLLSEKKLRNSLDELSDKIKKSNTSSTNIQQSEITDRPKISTVPEKEIEADTVILQSPDVLLPDNETNDNDSPVVVPSSESRDDDKSSTIPDNLPTDDTVIIQPSEAIIPNLGDNDTNDQPSLSPSEQAKIDALDEQIKSNAMISKSLNDTILKLAKENREAVGNVQGSDSSYTSNLLSIQEFSDTTEKMTDHTTSLFTQLESINADARKMTKSGQRDKLNELKVIKQLSTNVQNVEQREELQKFVKMTEQSINNNTNKFSSFVSGTMNNMGDITAVISGMMDSPLLAAGAAYFGGKIKQTLTERRERKFELQEGREEQLRETRIESTSLEEEREKIIQQASKRDEPTSDNTVPNNVPAVQPISPEQSNTIIQQPVSTNTNVETVVNNSVFTDLLEEANYELITISESIKDLETKLTTNNSSSEFVSELNTLRQTESELIQKINNSIELLSITNEKTSELIVQQSQNESPSVDIVPLTNTTNENVVQVSSFDDNTDNITTIDESQNIAENNSIVPLLEEANFSLMEISDKIGTSNISDLLDELNYEMINLTERMESTVNNNSTTTNESVSQVPITVKDADVINQLTVLETMLEPLVKGREENRREREVFNERLITTLESSDKGTSKITKGSTKGGGIMGMLSGFGGFDAMISGAIGGLMTGIMSKMKMVFRGAIKLIPKLLTRVFPPVAIVATLFSGITDAVDTFSETGDIKETAMSFFGGILDFVTFGIFGKESLESLLDGVKETLGPMYDIILTPFDYVMDTIESIMDSDGSLIEKLGMGLSKLNPIAVIVDSMTKIFEQLNEYIKETMDFDVGNIIKTEFDNIVEGATNIPLIGGLFESDDIVEDKTKMVGKKSGKKTLDDIAGIYKQYDRIVENVQVDNTPIQDLQQIYMMNNVPMNRDEFSQSTQGIIEPNVESQLGNFNQNNISSVNNSTQIIAPLPTTSNRRQYQFN